MYLIDQLSETGKEFLKRGVSLIGPSSGAYLGAISNDPNQVVMGAAIGEVIAQNINDFSNRSLSTKEKDNISITEVFSIAKIIENIKAGESANENLFDNSNSGNANEIYNGILTAAKNNYEDKKLEVLGRFYGNVVFQKDLQPFLIHFFLTTISNLNFNQICIISLVGQYEKYFKSLKNIEELQNKENWYELSIIQNELSNLIASGLLNPHEDALMTYRNKRHLNKSRLSEIGTILFNICELNKIDDEDLIDILKIFQ